MNHYAGTIAFHDTSKPSKKKDEGEAKVRLAWTEAPKNAQTLLQQVIQLQEGLVDAKTSSTCKAVQTLLDKNPGYEHGRTACTGSACARPRLRPLMYGSTTRHVRG